MQRPREAARKEAREAARKEARKEARKRVPSALAGWGLAVASVTLCLLAAEIAGRLLSPTASLWHYPNYIARVTTPDGEHEAQMRYDATLGYEPQPGFSGQLKGQPISFSGDGLRNHNRAAPRPAGPAILVLGDSLSEGYMVGDDQTWPAHLERLTGRPVLNAAVRGYGIDQMVLRAERLAPRLRPATMVLGFIPDDIDRTDLAVRDNSRKPYFVLAGDGLELRNVPVPETRPRNLTPLRRVLGYSYLADYAMRRLGLHELWYGTYRHVHDDGDAISCRLMDRLARLAGTSGARVLVVALYDNEAWPGPGTTPAGAAERRRSGGVLACAARAGLATLDTWDGFAAAGTARALPQTYINGHFTDRGNALAAKLIAAALETAAK